MNRRVILVSAFACLFWASTAQAEPKTHDGFYLQLNTGLGYYNVSTDTQFDESFSGVTIPFALLIGGSPVPGLAIGGGFFVDYAPSPTYEMSGVSSDLSEIDVTQFVIGIGPFVDVYPMPQSGLHFQGFIGWGGLETSAEGDVGGSDPTGLVTYLGGGYDWWVGDEWSIGVMGRLVIAPLSLNDISFMTIEPAVLATFTYH